jgi:hypothetical protein
LLLGSAFLIFWVKKSHFEKSVVDMTLFFVFFLGYQKLLPTLVFFHPGSLGESGYIFSGFFGGDFGVSHLRAMVKI